MTTKASAQREAEQAPRILELPIGIEATGKRKESDSLGEVEVPAERYWGAQTQRCTICWNSGVEHSLRSRNFQTSGIRRC
jgi:fumarate hydratase, class II